MYHDTATFSSCNSVTGPFPGFPVPLEGDDVSELIERHRDELPMSDQLPTFDPPKHTDHRVAADAPAHAEAPAGERGVHVATRRSRRSTSSSTAASASSCATTPSPSRCSSSPICSACPRTITTSSGAARAARTRAVGSTGDDALRHNPLEFLYERFTQYIEERRREPRGDVLTGLATATFRDGSTPEVIDVVRVAANLFAAGQETTVRLLAASMQLLGDDPDLQARLRADRDR